MFYERIQKTFNILIFGNKYNEVVRVLTNYILTNSYIFPQKSSTTLEQLKKFFNLSV